TTARTTRSRGRQVAPEKQGRVRAGLQRPGRRRDVTQCAVDCAQLVPMTDAIETNLGRKPDQLSADAGYCSEANLEALENRNIDGYVATGRARDAVAGTVKGEVAATTPSPEPAGAPTPVQAMPAKIR